jgi:Kef-type K+ transport system membrane component KefB
MLFTPVFIANIGIQTSFAGLDSNMIFFTGALIGAAILSKIIACGLGAKICRFSMRESVQIGTGMVARGEVTFIAAVKGFTVFTDFDSQLFSTVIAIVLVTVMITPILLKFAYSGKDSNDSAELG